VDLMVLYRRWMTLCREGERSIIDRGDRIFCPGNDVTDSMEQ
jgi:hypothetical protein